MAGTLARVREDASTVVGEVGEKNVSFMAGSIAYYAFVSLLPLLLLLLFVAALVDQGGVAQQVVDSVTSFAPAAGELLEGAIEGAQSGSSVSLIGAVVLLWGALKIFRGIDTAFSEIYETEVEESFLDQIRDGLVVLVSLGLALAATVVAGVVVAVFPLGPLSRFVPTAILLFGLALAFFPMYYVFPDAEVSPRGVLPGVIFAAVGWVVLQGLFQVYVRYAGQSETYGVLGGILVLVTWLYFGGLVLLIGAVVNAVVEGYAGRPSGTEGYAGEQTGDGGVETLSTDETARYLSSLREGLTGRYEGMDETEADDLPLPERDEQVEEVQVVEANGNGSADDGNEREVRLRWWSR